MATKQTTARATGELEAASFMLLSDAVKAYTSKQLADATILYVPDTGKARFNPSHVIESGKDKGKMSKACFIIAEQSYPQPIGFTQDNGAHKGLTLKGKFSVIASARNVNATTIEDALRVPETEAQATVRALTSVPEAKAS